MNASWTVFHLEDEKRDCEVYELFDIDDCANAAEWMLEDGSGDNVALCTTHKDEARTAGFIR